MPLSPSGRDQRLPPVHGHEQLHVARTVLHVARTGAEPGERGAFGCLAGCFFLEAKVQTHATASFTGVSE